MNPRRLVLVLTVLSSAGTVTGADRVYAPDLAATREKLTDQYPGLAVHAEGSGVVALYGRPMTRAPTPAEAAELWLALHRGALGVPQLDLRLQRANNVHFGRFTVFAYRQFIDGLPVEYGQARLLVLNGRPNRVVYVGARLARRPAAGFRTDAVEAGAAVSSVRQLPAYTHLTQWSDPELVIYVDWGRGGRVPAVRTWKFTGTRPETDEYEAYTFFVDAADGILVRVRNEVYHTGVSGHVSGCASPGLLPDVEYNPAVEMSLESVGVGVVDGNSTYTDEDGDYFIATSNGPPVTVETDLTGRWVNVSISQGSKLHLEQTVAPPGSSDFLFNPVPTEFSTAQVNAFVQTTAAHDFYKDRQSEYTGIDVPIPCIVNRACTCNAIFTGHSIQFYNAGDGCANTAYGSIIHHEYGHFIVKTLGLSQGAFGEGFADSVAVLLNDDPRIGPDLAGPGTYLRNIELAERRYPCDSTIHDCGQVLAGCWWDLKLRMQAALGENDGLEVTRQLFTDWSQITLGSIDSNSAHPMTVVEVLEKDDDDGDLTNGTPHVCEICSAFAAHNLPCPSVLGEDCTSNGIPDTCEPDCNSNGRADSCDVADAASEDCDHNGVPDECEPCSDCNSNGVRDAGDIAAGTSADCNGNGVPDECDITDGPSVDLDGNGVPDECILYVNAAAAGDGDGSSWTDAFSGLQEALEVAGGNPEVSEIWVASGTYTPDQGTGDRGTAFQLRSGLAIYGGFAGWETWREERDPTSNETILSGDLNGDDEPDFANNAENSYHVITSIGTDTTAVLDGLTLTAGNADGFYYEYNGGGLFNFYGSPTLTDCRFVENTATFGAGMYNRDSGHPTLIRCVFHGNVATGDANFTDGGGLYSRGAWATLIDCTFSENTATGKYPHGGGVYNYAGPLTLTGCTFQGNHVVGERSFGGGLHGGDATLVNCVFDGNTATQTEPASGLSSGGGFCNTGGSTLINCTFKQNAVAGSYSTEGGGLCTEESTLINCTFLGNSAMRGGAITDYGSSALTNCLFTGNTASMGGGLHSCEESNPTLINCTFSGNTADTFGGGLYNETNSVPTLANCILWGNIDAGGSDESAQIHGGPPSLSYSCIQGLDMLAGEGDIDDHPMFVDSNGLDDIAGTEDDDLRLAPGSPCIDAGSDGAVPPDIADLDGDGDTTEPNPFDLRGNSRFVDDPDTPDTGSGTPPIVDMGAYEFGADCNRNGIIDAIDIAAGTSQDCNSNGTPDECEPDADDDGVIDACDACPDSDSSDVLVIDGCDAGVANMAPGGDGCTMADHIAQLAASAINHGAFVGGIAHTTNEWKQGGLISGREKSRIQRCAAQADIP